MIRTATPLDIFLLAVLAASYGSAFTAIKIAVPHIGPFGLVLARVVIGFAVILPFALIRGWVWPSSRRTWVMVCFLCLMNLLVPFFLITWAQQHLDASLMALIMGAGPFFGLLISHIATRDDRLTGPKIAGVTIGFLGIMLVLGSDAAAAIAQSDLAMLTAPAAALLASLCYACSGVMVRHIDDVSTQQLASLVLGMGMVGLLTATPFVMPDAIARFAALEADALIAIVYLGAVVTGAAYLLRYYLIRAVGMSYFGLSIYLVPVFGVAIAALLLREPLTLTLIFGLVLVLAGMAVARHRRQMRR